MVTAYQLIKSITDGIRGEHMEVITIANQKGGVGKTTTASVLISGLTEKGYKVLGIDLDAQTNLTTSMGADSKRTALGVLTGECEAADAIVHTPTGDLIPSSTRLSTADVLLDETGKEYKLTEAIESIKKDYDYIIIDTPPSLGILTINALTACDYAIVPAQADLYSLQGISELAKTIDAIRKYTNPHIKVAGILLTMFNGRTRIAQEVVEILEKLAAQLNTKVFKTKIRASVKATEIQFKKGGLFKYAPRATVTEDYRNWIEELLRTL